MKMEIKYMIKEITLTPEQIIEQLFGDQLLEKGYELHNVLPEIGGYTFVLKKVIP